MSLVVPNTRWVVQKFQQMPVQGTHFPTQITKGKEQISSVLSSLSSSLPRFLHGPCSHSIDVQFILLSEHIYKVNFPADSEGNLCGVDFPGYNYIYLPNLDDIVSVLDDLDNKVLRQRLPGEW